jgi:hypothetical protein
VFEAGFPDVWERASSASMTIIGLKRSIGLIRPSKTDERNARRFSG